MKSRAKLTAGLDFALNAATRASESSPLWVANHREPITASQSPRAKESPTLQIGAAIDRQHDKAKRQ
jgi:hypothetical protein